jgi:hypothetical protein
MKKEIIIRYIFIIYVIFLFHNNDVLKAQYAPDYNTSDSVFIYSHSPVKATFYSAVLPGLGQIYNKKYWKVPIIYAGFGGLIYYVNYNNFVFKKYKEAYDIKLRIERGELGLEDMDSYPTASSDQLRSQKDIWRRYRDLSIIGIGILYVMQIIDADVDANLFDYDMSEDLSMRIEPYIINSTYIESDFSSTLGLRCSIKF